MSDRITLIPYDSWDFEDILFSFDADIAISRTDSAKWTSVALESGSEVSDYAVTSPTVYDISGIVSAWMSTTDDEVWTRLTDVYDALYAQYLSRQPVTLSSPIFVDDVVIVKMSAKRDQSTGEALNFSLQLQTFELAEFTTIEIPPELLADEVKPGATPEESTGGNQATEDSEGDDDFDPSAKSGAASIADGDNPSEILESIADTFS